MDIEKAKALLCQELQVSSAQLQRMIDEEIHNLAGLIDDESAIIIVAKKHSVYLNTDIQPLSDLLTHTIRDGNFKVKIVMLHNTRNVVKKDGQKAIVSKYFVKDAIMESDMNGLLVLWDQPEYKPHDMLMLYYARMYENKYNQREEITCKRASLVGK